MPACQMILILSVEAWGLLGVCHSGGSFSQNKILPWVDSRDEAHLYVHYTHVSRLQPLTVGWTLLHLYKCIKAELWEGQWWDAWMQGISPFQRLNYIEACITRKLHFKIISCFSDLGKETAWYSLQDLQMTLSTENLPWSIFPRCRWKWPITR